MIRVTWNIHWSCNYRCSYCFFDRKWTEYAGRNAYRSAEDWMSHWRRLHERYGRAYVVINGGEPFAYPGFLELLRRLSGIHWPVNVTTNGSLHLEEYARSIDHSRVSISLSLHPQFEDAAAFLDKVASLREAGAAIGCLNLVAYPPFLKDLPGIVERFRASGESLKVVPFIGRFRGVEYPAGYTREDLGMAQGWLESKRRKGTLCPAGHSSALLLPDGSVTRCGQVGDPGVFGSFFDPGFSLLPSPMPCDREVCPCDEWKTIPDEKAPKEARAWLP